MEYISIDKRIRSFASPLKVNSGFAGVFLNLLPNSYKV